MLLYLARVLIFVWIGVAIYAAVEFLPWWLSALLGVTGFVVLAIGQREGRSA